MGASGEKFLYVLSRKMKDPESYTYMNKSGPNLWRLGVFTIHIQLEETGGVNWIMMAMGSGE